MSDLFCIGLFADKYGLSSIYLQGTRSGANFVDDDGILINYFRWDNGEPQTDNYLRTSKSTYLQTTSSGLAFFRSGCCLYWNILVYRNALFSHVWRT